jgi:hypothetical protein
MFRRRPDRAGPIDGPPKQTGRVPTGYQAQTTLIAAPDLRSIARLRALSLRIGMGLQGHTGTPYGYDKGDPANSLTGPVDNAQGSVARAQAAVTTPYANSFRPGMSFQDQPLADPELDPYNTLLWNRMNRA